MSRLWADRLYVALAPESVVAARVRGIVRPKLVSKSFAECEDPVEALRAAIGAVAKERLEVTVVLSNRFVRYAVVPFDPAISGADEELALARFHFARIHGERVKGWELRLSEGPHGAARIASAMDESLLKAIRACFPRGGRVRLVSLQPYLMAAFNCGRGAIGKDGAWLVLLERERACLALASRGGWQAVQSLRVDGAGETWLELLERERLRSAAASPRVALVHGARGAAETAQWKLLQLSLPRVDGYSPLEDARYAMALCAL